MLTVFESSFRSLRCFSLAFASASLSSYSHYFSVSFSSSCCVGCGCGCLTENCIEAKYTRDRNHLKRKWHFAKPDSREKVF